jgi:hypothetical protein
VAIYHLSAKSISRGSGRSATAAAAYRAGVEIVDERTGVVHDFTRKGGVLHAELVLPGGGTADRSEFWNRVELHHKRGDAVLVREIEVALPAELPADQRCELATSYARELADRYQVAADVALHAPRTVTDRELEKNPDQHHETDPETGRRHNGNWHAHIMLSACHVQPDGTLGKKAVELDPIHCQRAKIENAADRERPRWAALINGALEQAGEGARVDHRSLSAQGIDAPRPIHEGPAVSAMRRRGTPSNVVQLSDYQREIRRDRAALREVEAEIISLEAARARREAEQVHGAALRENVEWHRAQIAGLAQRGAAKPSREVIEAQRRKEAAQQAQAEAKRAAAEADAWRAAHPLRAAIQDQLGIPPATDRAADEAQAAARAAAARYKRFSGLPEARQWVDDNRALRQLQERLPGVERAAGIEPQAERDARSRAALDEARRLLRRAAGRVDNELTRATRDEARELFELRREIEAKLTEIEGQPELSEAERLQAAAVQYQERAEGWRAAANARQADAKQAAPSDHQERAQPRPDDDPRPRNRGPRLG